jgi:hypothetical protein
LVLIEEYLVDAADRIGSPRGIEVALKLLKVSLIGYSLNVE